MKTAQWLMIIAFLLGMALMFIGGFYLGASVVFQETSHYKDMSIATCDYANFLTDIINNQSEIINKIAGEDLKTLDQINCSKLT